MKTMTLTLGGGQCSTTLGRQRQYYMKLGIVVCMCCKPSRDGGEVLRQDFSSLFSNRILLDSLGQAQSQ